MQRDKLNHLVWSYAICLTGCMVFNELEGWNLLIGFAVAMVIGIVKEVRDMSDNNPETYGEWKDLVSDFFGCVLGVMIYGFFYFTDLSQFG